MLKSSVFTPEWLKSERELRVLERLAKLVVTALKGKTLHFDILIFRIFCGWVGAGGQGLVMEKRGWGY